MSNVLDAKIAAVRFIIIYKEYIHFHVTGPSINLLIQILTIQINIRT